MIGLQRLAAASWLFVFLAVYVPAVGRGFVTDDFNWVTSNAVHSAADLRRIVTRAEGFYRPVVSLSFAANERVFHNAPRGYGLTNIALALLTAAGIGSLCRALGLSGGGSLFAAALWLMNFHGINMGLLWLSGRTSLLACAGSVWAVSFAMRGRLLPAAALLGIALFSKEEALLVGFVVLSWMVILGAPSDLRTRRALIWAVLSVAVTAAYLTLRQMSGAMTPSSAPWYYTFTFDPRHLAANAREYADRVATTALVAGIGAAALLKAPRDMWPPMRTLAIACAVWVAGGLALTFFLPVRSDLYALLPSIGACVLAGAVAGEAWRRASEPRRRAALVIAISAPVLLSPVYLARTHRWVELANLSTTVLDDLDRYSRAISRPVAVTIEDRQSTRANIDSAFAGGLSRGFTLWTGRTIQIETVANADSLSTLAARCPDCEHLRLRLVNGRLEPAR